MRRNMASDTPEQTTDDARDAARYRWLVRNEYVSSELWDDFPAGDTGTDPSLIIDDQIAREDFARESARAELDEIMRGGV